MVLWKLFFVDDRVGGHKHLTGTLVSVLEVLMQHGLKVLESLWTTKLLFNLKR